MCDISTRPSSVLITKLIRLELPSCRHAIRLGEQLRSVSFENQLRTMSSKKKDVLSDGTAVQPLDAIDMAQTPSTLKGQVSNEIDTLFRLFVKYAWEATYGKRSMASTAQLIHWLLSENIDISSSAWYTPESMHIWKRRGQLISAKLAYTLRFILPILLKCDGDVKYVDEYGQTVLHVFLKHYTWNYQPRLEADFKLNTIVAALMTRGASINHADNFGNTPLSIAATGLRRDLCWMMLRYFDNVDACDYKGETVLHKVAGNRSLSNAWCDIVRALLRKGADPSRKNREGLSPVHLAARSGKDGILRIFAENDAELARTRRRD